MIQEGIFLANSYLGWGIEMNKAKIIVIEKLLLLVNVKKKSKVFMGHVGFCWRVMKYVLKISKPLSNLLIKYVQFIFNMDCLRAFQLSKEPLILTPILQTSNLVLAIWGDVWWERQCYISYVGNEIPESACNLLCNQALDGMVASNISYEVFISELELEKTTKVCEVVLVECWIEGNQWPKLLKSKYSCQQLIFYGGIIG